MKWVLAAVVAVVVVVAVVLVVRLSGTDDPPAKASGAGVFRLHPTALANGGQRAPDDVTYDGVTFRVAFGGALGSGATARAGMTVTGPGGTLKPYAKYAVGDTIALDGATLKVRTVFKADADADDLVDVQVLPG